MKVIKFKLSTYFVLFFSLLGMPLAHAGGVTLACGSDSGSSSQVLNISCANLLEFVTSPVSTAECYSIATGNQGVPTEYEALRGDIDDFYTNTCLKETDRSIYYQMVNNEVSICCENQDPEPTPTPDGGSGGQTALQSELQRLSDDLEEATQLINDRITSEVGAITQRVDSLDQRLADDEVKINDNTSKVTANTDAIQNNKNTIAQIAEVISLIPIQKMQADIASNKDGILVNKAAIETNSARISTLELNNNGQQIEQNRIDILDLKQVDVQHQSSLALFAAGISDNRTGMISLNNKHAADINLVFTSIGDLNVRTQLTENSTALNTGSIADNVIKISDNSAAIAANSGGIEENRAAIDALSDISVPLTIFTPSNVTLDENLFPLPQGSDANIRLAAISLNSLPASTSASCVIGGLGSDQSVTVVGGGIVTLADLETTTEDPLAPRYLIDALFAGSTQYTIECQIILEDGSVASASSIGRIIVSSSSIPASPIYPPVDTLIVAGSDFDSTVGLNPSDVVATVITLPFEGIGEAITCAVDTGDEILEHVIPPGGSPQITFADFGVSSQDEIDDLVAQAFAAAAQGERVEFVFGCRTDGSVSGVMRTAVGLTRVSALDDPPLPAPSPCPCFTSSDVDAFYAQGGEVLTCGGTSAQLTIGTEFGLSVTFGKTNCERRSLDGSLYIQNGFSAEEADACYALLCTGP